MYFPSVKALVGLEDWQITNICFKASINLRFLTVNRTGLNQPGFDWIFVDT